jgi:CelD/BcsL family acetyltransferase involved in cellulose biosynthesis
MHPSFHEPLRFQPGEHPELATTTAAVPDVWREWDELAEQVGAAPFLRPGWFAAWHSAYGEGELRVLTVHDGARLAGILPIETRGRATLSATNSHSPLYGPVASSPEAERALVSTLVKDAEGRIELCYVDPGTTWYGTLDTALRSDRRRIRTTTVMRSPYVLLQGPEGGYADRLSRRFLKDLRRRRRRLEEQGHVEVTVHQSARHIDAALEQFVELESSGWKAANGTAIASRDASRKFYAEIARWAADSGWLRLAFLTLDGRPIAAEFDLQCGGSMYALKSGFDPEYRGFAPGHLLTAECLEQARIDGLASYEFLGTDEPYKMNWTETTRERVRVECYPRTLAGRVQAIKPGLRPLVRRLRRR